jgi:thiol:disulfide interchange protein
VEKLRQYQTPSITRIQNEQVLIDPRTLRMESLLMRKLLVLSIFFIPLLGISLAQSSADLPVRWSVRPPANPLQTGAPFEIAFEAAMDKGWHIYSATQVPPPVATRFNLPPQCPLEIAGKVRQSKPKIEFDRNFEIQAEIFPNRAEFWVPFKVSASTRPGDYTVNIEPYFQVCTDRSCLPPQGVPITIALKIVPGASQSAGSLAQNANRPITHSPAGTPAEVQQARAGGFLPFLWLSMTMGALSLATPCVFPMIPITVSYFTKSTETNRSAGWRLAFVYSLGIILTFTGLGLGLAALLGATGINQFAANPWINLLITAVFFGFAFNLFGLYQVGIPSSILTKLSKAGAGSGYASALLMGLTFTLTSFTCTVPFIGTVLVATAQGDWLWPAMGMLGFAIVFAAPFFLLALAPRMLAALPKNGEWLNSVKVTMGFLEVAAAMKFISNVDLVWRWHIFTREVVLCVWLATCLLAAMYLLGKFQLLHDTPLQQIGVLRMTAALCFLALVFFLFTGLMGAGLGEIDAFLPPRTVGTANLNNHLRELSWNTDLQSAQAEARRQNKPIFIDFTGYTCTNCRWMETNIFTLPAVYNCLQKYIRLQLFTDGAGKIYADNQNYQKETFGTVALPLYIILDSQGNKLAIFPGMTRNAAEFERFLNTPFANQN